MEGINHMNIDIFIGSVLGASEYVAEAIQAMLKDKGHEVSCYFTPSIQDFDPTKLLLIVTSTHGAGDLPDNIQVFADDLKNQDLSDTKAIIIGLGDSSYDTFCQGSATIEQIILDAGGKVLFPVYQIDVLHHPIPEDVAVKWLSTQIDTINPI